MKRRLSVLAAAFAFMLMTSACGSNGNPTETTTVTVAASTTATTERSVAVPPLRPAATSFARQTGASTTADGYYAVLRRWAQPACAEQMIGLVKSLTGSDGSGFDENEPAPVVHSVEQDGDTGTTLIDTTTYHWEYSTSGGWRFNCTGLMPTLEVNTEPAPTYTEEPTQDPVVLSGPCPAVGERSEDASGTPMRCIAADGYGGQRWAPAP
ncbi:hypothetical protein SEA_FIREBALL_47 [Gordonia phage Fireball]|uniref:Lipoprotein n=2 Tax=Wizardvirus TaxID=2169658 RepID=A0A5P8DBR7_9CAUD|nr:hypothetical protein KNU74_gp47 [Gordonia phage Fireball]QFP95872.1 hypothetical protein SEA_FIREBALL_47 [Gordonia phage Fireball]